MMTSEINLSRHHTLAAGVVVVVIIIIGERTCCSTFFSFSNLQFTAAAFFMITKVHLDLAGLPLILRDTAGMAMNPQCFLRSCFL